jgi:uncharacterized protein (DUF1697 family)
MTDLRETLSALGFAQPRTLLQSGNAVFECAARPSADLERRLEDALSARLGLETDVFVRTALEWAAVVARNPFPAEASRDPRHLVLLCLKDAPRRPAIARLQAAITGREILRAAGRHAYVVYPDGIGRSRLTNTLIETVLGAVATGRNWNTVVKLAALAHV